MGFKTGAWAKVWSVEPIRDTVTSCRLSVSKKNRDTGEYEQEWGGFVSFLGTAAASKATKLKEYDSIKLGDVDVTTRYDKEKEFEYVNYNCYSFKTNEEVEEAERSENASHRAQNTQRQAHRQNNTQRPTQTVDVNYGLDGGEAEAELPF